MTGATPHDPSGAWIEATTEAVDGPHDRTHAVLRVAQDSFRWKILGEPLFESV